MSNRVSVLSLIHTIAGFSLKEESSRYFLGYFWWVAEPALFVAVFYLVFKILLQMEGDDFLLFLICGKLPFIWFSKSVTSAAPSIVNNSGLIGGIDLPKFIFPLAKVQESAYKQAVVFIMLLAFAAWLGPAPSLAWFWLVPILLAQYIMILAVALWVSYLVCYLRDIEFLVGMGMLLMLFLSGVFWDVRSLPDPDASSWLLKLNPLAFILDAYRQVLMFGKGVDVAHLLALIGVFSLVAVSAWFVMRRQSRSIALRVLGA